MYLERIKTITILYIEVSVFILKYVISNISNRNININPKALKIFNLFVNLSFGIFILRKYKNNNIKYKKITTPINGYIKTIIKNNKNIKNEFDNNLIKESKYFNSKVFINNSFVLNISNTIL